MAVRAGVPQVGARYAVLNGVLISPLQVPCIQPPFGQLTAVDLDNINKIPIKRGIAVPFVPFTIVLPSITAIEGYQRSLNEWR